MDELHQKKTDLENRLKELGSVAVLHFFAEDCP